MEMSLSNQIRHKNEMLELEKNLRNAIERDELFIHYQPKLSLTSGGIVGIEALIRWNHPKKGVISPAEFIPLAEETGLINPIGEWVLRSACLQNKTWQESGLTPMIISVNLSVRQLYQPNFIEIVIGILQETKLAPEFLEFEITESMLMDIEHGIKILKELKSIGVQLSLDDFGTGYSSLQHLKRLPINKLKIDQSFIRNCIEDTNDSAIVKTIIAMAHQLKLTVVAEGVESRDHLIFLQRNLCDEAQGYLFSKPIPPDKIFRRFGEIEQIITKKGIPKELSNRKWSEEAIQLARQELVETVRQQQGMIFKFKKKDGKFIHTLCDGELLYRMGLLPEQIIDRELNDFLPADIAKIKGQYYQSAWYGKDYVTYECKVNNVECIVSLRPIQREGQVVEVIGSCVDITEMKQFKEALIQSESNYRLIAENMTDLVTVCDVKGRITYASPSLQKVLGFLPKPEAPNQENSWVHPDDIPLIEQQFNQIVSTKTPSQIEFRVRHQNGQWLYVETQFNPVIGANGVIEHIIVFGRDISERKRIDEFMCKTQTLSVAGHLAAGIAHEIRNPLTSIKGFLQMLQQEFNKSNYIDIALSEINNIEKIIKEFLTLAKPQASQTLETDIMALLQKVITLINTQAILNNIEIVPIIDPDLPQIYCDNYQIKKVLIKILQNSIQAMHDGGQITIRATRDGSRHIKIHVVDQGCGISKDRMKRIYEPFYSIKEKGTGIGLMICHKIIQDHGGTIQFNSEINQGTTIDIVLPIKIEINSGNMNLE
ncbi:EAL domain-containing protein [Bacillus sp. S/N-304-OC-R1]|uniref:EAL domain-containing protein n=1 Tax=Bacillus sp. S/N-304-OC-R1 TaxID=2758034 RepID=UPI001C8D8488|nr:EAL domain-containing protein [Bacillus sp. S/N-304-OC-R1]MBY0121205.1 EAL domain-containing protein [Bacillus sp. S/N-304-OC-R1]